MAEQYDYKRMFDLIQNSTFIQNVNTGVTVPYEGAYFGAKTGEGMAYAKDSMYNRKKPDTCYADMSKPQSNYMNLRGNK